MKRILVFMLGVLFLGQAYAAPEVSRRLYGDDTEIVQRIKLNQIVDLTSTTEQGGHLVLRLKIPIVDVPQVVYNYGTGLIVANPNPARMCDFIVKCIDPTDIEDPIKYIAIIGPDLKNTLDTQFGVHDYNGYAEYWDGSDIWPYLVIPKRVGWSGSIQQATGGKASGIYFYPDRENFPWMTPEKLKDYVWVVFMNDGLTFHQTPLIYNSAHQGMGYDPEKPTPFSPLVEWIYK